MSDVHEHVEDCGHDHEGDAGPPAVRLSPWWSWNEEERYTSEQFCEAIAGWKMTLPVTTALSGSIVSCLTERQHGPMLSAPMRGVRRFGTCHCDERRRINQMLRLGSRGIGPRMAVGISH